MSLQTFQLFPETNSDLAQLSSKEAYLRSHTREILKTLWKDAAQSSSRSMFSWQGFRKLWQQRGFLSDFYHTLFVENDSFFLKAARLEVQTALANLLDQLQQGSYEKTDQVDMAIHNILAIYAMFCPNRYEPITIPIYQNQQWLGVQYQVTPLELTPNKGRWLNVFSDTDRLYSYGLSPIDNDSSPPLLLHAGTGWPTAQGSLSQYLADIWPFKTPGEIFFEWGLTSINQWLDKQSDGAVITLGQSLGGSMAYLTALHRPEKIAQADCLNPPGMIKDYDLNHPLFGAWEQAEQKPYVRIQRQQNDLVSKCGTFKKDFHCVKISATSQTHRSLLTRLGGPHARSYASFDGVKFSRDNLVEQEIHSKQRHKNNFFLFKWLRIVLFYCVLIPYTLLIRPLKKFAEKHAFELLLFALFVVLLTTVPPFSSLLGLALIPWLGSSLASAILPAMAFSQVISKGILFIHDVLFNDKLQLKQFVSNFKSKPWWGKLYDISNIITLGLVSISYRTFKRLILNPLRHLSEVREHGASVFSQETADKTSNFEDYKGASFSSKLQLGAIITFVYLIVIPLKFLFYDIPCAVIQCCRSKTSDDDETTETRDEHRPESAPQATSTWSFKSLFTCCTKPQPDSDDDIPKLLGYTSHHASMTK